MCLLEVLDREGVPPQFGRSAAEGEVCLALVRSTRAQGQRLFAHPVRLQNVALYESDGEQRDEGEHVQAVLIQSVGQHR